MDFEKNKKSKTDILGKSVPHNIEAEQALLGSILINSKVIDEILSYISPMDFYSPKHKKIFNAMRELSEKNEAIDTVTLIEELRLKGILEDVGGASYISSLSDIVPTAANALEYAKIIKEKSILRQIIDLSTELIENSYNEELDPKEILEKAEANLFEIAEHGQRENVIPVKDLIYTVYESIVEKKHKEGLMTGFKRIDENTTGFHPGELIIIAARPSIGKTSLALTISYKLGVKEDKSILIFSFEMSKEDIMRRLLAMASRVSLQKIRKGGYFLKKEDKSSITTAATDISNSNIWIDTGNNNVFDIKAKSRFLMNQLKRQNKKLDLILIDYLQLIDTNRDIPREQQIAHISRTLKSIARELNIPVIALAQLNREAEKREGKKGAIPKLSDIRESGAIEQDADIVIFIHREDEREMEASQTDIQGTTKPIKVRKMRLIIKKNRNGPTGDQEVYFIPDYTSFEEIANITTDEDFSKYEETNI